MAGARPASLSAALSGALAAINNTKASVKQAAGAVFNPPPVEDQGSSATPAPTNVAKS